MIMVCPNETFQCSSNGCLAWDYVCDGIEQCLDGEDEKICGKCINNKYLCIDGTEMTCELSCSILGFIPCSKYRNRITCISDYPNALASYNREFNLLSNKYKSFSIENLFYNYSIFGALIILVFLLIVIFIVTIVIRKNKNNLKFKKKTNVLDRRLDINNSNNNNKRNIDLNTKNESCINDNQQNIYEIDDDLYYNEHNYQEIIDSDYNEISTNCGNQDRFSIQIPPPYSSVHLFQNFAKNDQILIKGKVTYV